MVNSNDLYTKLLWYWNSIKVILTQYIHYHSHVHVCMYASIHDWSLQVVNFFLNCNLTEGGKLRKEDVHIQSSEDQSEASSEENYSLLKEETVSNGDTDHAYLPENDKFHQNSSMVLEKEENTHGKLFLFLFSHSKFTTK